MIWAISKKEDRASNNIKYSYYQPRANSGEHLLRYIRYTGYNGNDGNRVITYNYGDRNKFSSSYLAGGLTRKTKRLTSIFTAVDGVLARKYTFNYNTKSLASGRSLLRNVQECGYKFGVEKCLPATAFEWQEKAPEFIFEKLQYTENNQSFNILQDKRWLHDVLPHGDTNGDGVRDFPGVYINAEGEKTGEHSESLSTCFKLPNAFISSCLEVDLNADGRTDSFRQHNDKLEIKYSTTNTWINTGIAWPRQRINAELGEILGFSDFNGDGFPDMAMKQRLLGENSKLWVFFNTKSLATPFNNSNKQLIREYPNVNLNQNYGLGELYNDAISIQLHGDLDGNGTGDFIEFDSGLTSNIQAPGLPLPEKMLLITPNGATFSITEKALTGRISSYNYNGNLFHDLNGDGLVDWLSMSENSSAIVYRLNTGGNFESTWKSLGFSLPIRNGLYELAPGVPEPYFYPIMSRFTVMDYDGDGVQDLILGDDIVASSCAKVLDYYGSNWKCDDELYTGFTKGYTGSQVDAVETPINSDIVDDSIRNYNAVKFVQALDGSISVEIEVTDIIASSTQRAVIDVTGDGLPDVITTFGCRFGECEWNNETSNHSGTVQNSSLQTGVYINRNIGSASGLDGDRFGAQDTLKAVVNGLGKRDEWIYKPLSSEAYNTNYSAFYEADHAATSSDRDYFNFASSMNVVAEHKVSNGIGGENSTKYRYRGAMFNNKGRGFQGFKSIIVEQNNFENSSSEAHRDTISRTDFTQKWPLSGIMQQSCTWLASNVSLATNDNEGCVGVISKTLTNSIVNKVTTDGARFVAIDSSTSIRYDLASGAELSRQSVEKNFDDNGNATLVAQSNTDSYGTFANNVVTNFIIDKAEWWLNKVSSITTTKSVSGTQAAATESSSVLDKVTTVVPNTWHTTLRKPKKITTSGDGVNFTVETIYNNYGLPSAVTQSGEVLEGLTDTQKTQWRTTNFTYTNLGNSLSADGYFPYTVSSSSGATNLTTTTQYNPNYGLPIHVTNADGTVTVSDYDNFGRLESSKQTGFPTKYLRYYANDSHAPAHSAYRVASMAAGTPLQNVYVDILGRTLRTAVASFNNTMVYQDKYVDRVGMTTVEYGPHYSTSSDKPTVTYENYDALGRPQSKSTLQENGSTLNAMYSYVGLSTDIDANGLYMSRTYNSLNMLVSTTDANVGSTHYAYDAAKNPITIKDASGSLIKARYDALGRKLYVNDPNQGITTFSYNDFGEVEKEVDANNDSIRYDMDLLGRVIKRYDYGNVNGASTKSNVTSTFIWDTVKKGLLTSEQSSGSKKSYQYDSAARLTVTTSVLDSYTYQTSAYYDANYGRPTGIKYPNDLLVAYDYKSNGYLEKEYNVVSGYVYKKVTAQDAFGNITAALVNDNVTANTNMYSQVSGQMLSTKARVNGQLIHDITYDRFDSFGNIVEQNNNIHQSNEVFAYDDLHRLTSSTKTIGITSATINYGYDAVGNITQKSDYANSYYYNETGNAGPNAVTSVTKINGAGTATFAYDKKGNLITGDGKTLYYNVHNKPTNLAKGGVSSQLYYGASLDRYKQVVINGGFGNRTTYYVDKLYEVEINNDKVKWRAYISDTAIISHDDIDKHKIHFTHRDRLGSATTFSDHNGAVTAYRGYDPFGKPLGGDWSDLLPATLVNNPYDSDMPTYRGFTDHEHLDEIELIHMNGRVYDYNLGRFLSVDPFIQEPGNSQSLNPYSYIMNNPLAGTDPTGYKSETVEMKDDDKLIKMDDGNTYLDQGGDSLIKVDSVTATSSNGSSTTVNMGSSGSTSDIGSQNNVAQNDSQSSQSFGDGLKNGIQSQASNMARKTGEELGMDENDDGGVNAQWGNINRDEDGNITQASVVCGMPCKAEAGLYSYKHSMDLIRIRNQNDYGALANEALYEIGSAFTMAWGLGTGARYVASEWALLNSTKQAAVFNTMTHFQSLAYAEQLIHMQVLLKAGQYGVPRTRALLKLREGEKIMKTKMRMKVREQK